MTKISLLIVATNRYTEFLPQLLRSVKENFFTEMDVTVNVFTDKLTVAAEILNAGHFGLKIHIHEVEHKPWPHATLKRFHFFRKYLSFIDGHYVCYIDADTIIKEKIGEEILSPRTVVAHCGFVNGGGSWESRKESRAFTPQSIQKQYYGGGFWLFDRSNFRVFIDTGISMIDEDEKNGIIPVWHDESVLNAFMASVEPKKVLSPSYHWPQNNKRIWDSWKEAYPCKILLLDKDHKKYQV